MGVHVHGGSWKTCVEKVMKEYNHETKHAGKYKNMDMEQRRVEELKRGLESRQALFRKAKSQIEAF